jgi:sugar lactone lactonase YvrE
MKTTRSRFRLLAAAMLSMALSLTLVAPAEAKKRNSYPDKIALPNGFRPEGITIGKRPIAYVGSLADGDIYAADLRSGKGKVIVPGNGTPSVGLKISRDGRTLYVAGGAARTAKVIDLRTRVTETIPLTTKTSFINDLVLTRRFAWFTNSQQPELYRLSRRTGEVTPVPLTGDWVQRPGFNANGIALTPNGRALLVVNSTTGTLYRVNPSSGVATAVDLGGELLTNGDGLLVKGRTLYVVQNFLNQVAVFKLNGRGTEGRLVTTLTSDEFDVPTTVAAYKGSLYLPNARFSDPPLPADAEYWITRIDRER